MGAAPVDRLRESRTITAVLRGRRQRAGRLVVLHALPNEQDAVRLAVVASRRVGNAVRRNRAKRLLREASGRVAWRPGWDLVVVARAACADSGLDDVQAELTRLAGDCGLLTREDRV